MAWHHRLALVISEDSVASPADAETNTAGAAPAPAGIRLDGGARIGRFTVLEIVGAGGMGEVYAAYDSELDRRVALKVLRHSDEEQRLDLARKRLRREAQALAQVIHPNVVSVHEVGEHHGQVFVAMEFVEGDTLKSWIQGRDLTRERDALLDLLLQAGRGLLAAHEQGLVHRDFKPGNVLVGNDGRVRVVDFGLARTAPRTTLEGKRQQRSQLGAAQSRQLDVEVTSTGTIVGTPAYMSPEQLYGEPVDARSDQFSFAVVVWEMLFGGRPYAAKALGGYIDAIESRRPEKLNESTPLPRRLESSLRRALSPRVAQRFTSLRPLLDAIESARAGSRKKRGRRLILIGTGLAAVVAAATYGAIGQSDDELCSGGPALIAEVWDEERSEGLSAALRASAAPSAAETEARLIPQLDTYASQWAGAHRDACEATALRKEQTEATLDSRLRCLDDARREVDAVVSVLEVGGTAVVDRALDLVYRLPSVPSCGKPAVLSARSDEVPAEQRAEVDAIKDVMARARAQRRAGKPTLAIQTLQNIKDRAMAVTHAPTRLQWQFEVGLGLHAQGKTETAAPVLLDSYSEGRRLGLDLLTLRAATNLASNYLNDGENEIAEQWLLVAEAEDQRVGDHSSEAHLLAIRGYMLLRQGHLTDAESVLRRVIEDPGDIAPADRHLAMLRLAEVLMKSDEIPAARKVANDLVAVSLDYWGRFHPYTNSAYKTLCDALARQGRGEEATRACEQAVDIGTQLDLPGRTQAQVLLSLAYARVRAGRLAAAKDANSQAVDLFSRHPTASGRESALRLQATLDRRLGDAAAAVGSLRALVQEQERRHGEEHPSVGATRRELANGLLDAGDAEAALLEARRAAEVAALAEGSRGHVAAAELLVAYALQDLGRPAESLAPAQRAYDIWAETDPARCGFALNALGRGRLLLGDAERALPHLKEALALAQKDGLPAIQIAQAHFAVASMQVQLGQGEAALENVEAAARLNAEITTPTAHLNEQSARVSCDVYSTAHRWDKALAACTQLDSLLTGGDYDPAELGEASMTAARRLWRWPEYRAAARKHALAAEQEFRESGDGGALRDCRAWLRRHRG